MNTFRQRTHTRAKRPRRLTAETLEWRLQLSHSPGVSPTVLDPADLMSTMPRPSYGSGYRVPEVVSPVQYHGNPILLAGRHPNADEETHGDHSVSDLFNEAFDEPWTLERESVRNPRANPRGDGAQHLPNVGTRPGNESEVSILGSLDVTAREISISEDDGSITRANPTGLLAQHDGSIIARGQIGDGPHGSHGTATGDYDYYKFSARAGQLISINVEGESANTVATGGPVTVLDPVAGIYDAHGNLLTFNDNIDYIGLVYSQVFGSYDNTKAHFDSAFRFQPAVDGDYFVVVFSSLNFQSSAFDSGAGAGVYSEGRYLLSITKQSPDSISTIGLGADYEDGAIQFATDTGIQAGSDGFVYASGYIGDGLHSASGSGTGDFDMYRFDAAQGQQIYLSADTDPRLSSVILFDDAGLILPVGMDSKIILYDGFGNILGFNEDYQSLDGVVNVIAPYTGTYYASVSGYSGGNMFIDADEYFSKNLLANPFDAASGGGSGTEGFYRLLIKTETVFESDTYTVDLQAGDIFSLSAIGDVGSVQMFDPNGNRLHVSYAKESYFFIEESPLIRGVGDVAYDRVITQPGRYSIVLTQQIIPGEFVLPWDTPAAPYVLEVRVHRPGFEYQPAHTHQVVYLDFDRSAISDFFENNFLDPHNFLPGVLETSSLGDQLSEFGLNASDEDIIIDRILDIVEDKLVRDVGGAAGRGLNGELLASDNAGEYQLTILNSRDHEDVYGLYPNVSRVFIGASFDELNIDSLGGFLGLANSIDAGNYDFDDQAIVVAGAIIDLLNEQLDIGLFSIAPTSSRLELLATAIGKTLIHEIAHNIGAWHTNPLDDRPEMMDSGGGLGSYIRNSLGIGPDNIFGSTDDVDVRFTSDSTFSALERLLGSVNDTLNTVAFGLSTGTQAGTYFDFVTGTLYVSGGLNDGHQDQLSVRTVGGQVEVTINGEVVLTQPSTHVQLVVLNGSDDRDELDAEGYDGPVKILGKGGDDRLGGGSGDDVLLGGPGRDRLEGRDGNDLLIGGDGHDLLSGQAGDDILIGGLGQDEMDGGRGEDLLIGGSTIYDQDLKALTAVLLEWTANRGYQDRVNNLKGVGGGPRSNGNFFLTADGTDPTVFDDEDVDRLFGGKELDWYFARLRGRKKDILPDFLVTELLQVV